MPKKFLQFAIIPLIIIGFFVPVVSVNAAGNYTYRSTVIGTGVSNVQGNVYEINGVKSNYSTGEKIYALTRIFNITNIDSFQFKHEATIRGGSTYKTFETPIYRPYRNWWAETYAWNDLGYLPSGYYDLKNFIKINNGNWQQLGVSQFSVSGNNYYDYRNNNNYNNPTPNCNSNSNDPRYDYAWSKSGTGVSGYSVSGEKSVFSKYDNVYVMSKLAEINDVDSFRIKHELYRDGRTFYKREEGPTQYPHDGYWRDHYYWSNFGRLNEGNYEVRVFASIEGGSYQLAGTINIRVGDSYYNNDGINYDDNNYNNYHYDWSETDTDVSFEGGYKYAVYGAKTNFYENENVVVLTKLSKISGINNFRIKHQLYRQNVTMVKENISETRFPRDAYWEYNYTHSNFGMLNEGNYTIKTYISIEGGSYHMIGQKAIRVVNGHSYHNDDSYSYGYHYDWTDAGLGIYPVL